MIWPEWMKIDLPLWLIGVIIGFILAAIGIFVSIILSRKSPIKPEDLAKKLANKLIDNQAEEKDAEIKNLKETLERFKKDLGDILKQKALLALSKGNIEKAEKLLRKSVEKRIEKGWQDWFDLGNIAYLNNPYKALEAYQKVIVLDSFNIEAWNRSALILHRLGRLDEAKRAYKRVLELTGEEKSYKAVAYGSLGNIYQTRGDLDLAEEYYQKSLEINKKIDRKHGIANQYGSLGNIYQTRGDLDLAEEYYRKSLKINKKLDRKYGMGSDYGNLGIIYQTDGDLDKACSYWQKSLKLFSYIGAKDKIAIVQAWINQDCKRRA